jgi:hypothetical protein
MKSEHQELARQIFVFATSMLEDGHEVTMAGQSHRLTATDCARYTEELTRLAQELGTIAVFLQLLAQLEPDYKDKNTG